MRPRPLAQDSAVIRATGFADLSVSAFEIFKQAASAPTVTDLTSNALKLSQDIFNNLSPEERADIFRAGDQALIRFKDLQDNLYIETDEIKREQIRSELEEIEGNRSATIDLQVKKMVQDGRLLSIDALNEEFGDILTFDRPVSRENAELLYKNKREEIVRNAIIEKGLNGVAGYSGLFAGSLVAVATDPIELAASFIPYFGQARRAAAVARFGRFRGRAMIGAGEGLAGSLLTEPLYYGLSKQQQLDYSMGEALLNIGVGTFLGSGIRTVEGVFAKPKIDYGSILSEADVPEDLAPRAALAEPPKISEKEALAKVELAKQRVLQEHNVLGGYNVARTALNQFVSDHAIDVSPVMPKAMKRPMDLGQFVRERGGINDADKTFRGELKSFDVKGVRGYYRGNTYINGIRNPDGVNLDEMADYAFQAGFLSKRDTNELVEKLRDTSAGRYHFAAQDQADAELWRSVTQARDDFEAEMANREAIRQHVTELTGRDVSDEEVAIISDYMARTGDDIEIATEQIQVKLYEAEAEVLARYGANPRSDVGADFDAAEEIDAALPTIQDQFDFENELAQNEAILRQLEDAGELTKDDLELIAGLREVDETIDAYIDLVQVAAICTARA